MINTICDLLEESKLRESDVAFKYHGIEDNINTKNWSDFHNDVTVVYNWLVKHNMKNERISLLCRNDYSIIVALFAVCSSRNISVMLDPNEMSETLCANMESVDSNLVFCNNETKHLASEVKKNSKSEIAVFNIAEIISRKSDSSRFLEIDKNLVKKNDVAVIMFTSGTTGIKKAVPLTNENIISNVISYSNSCGEGCDNKLVTMLPFHHAFGLVASLLIPIYLKMPIFLNDSFLNLKSDIDYYKPSVLVVTPGVISFLIKICGSLKNGLGDSVRWVISGGGFLPEKLEDEFDNINVAIYNGYGITECSPIIAVNTKYLKRKGSVGKVLDCCEIKFSCDNEILVKGKNVTSGYLNADNSKLFNDGWFNTKDIGYLGKDGELYITGRTKKLIILSNGENVPAEMLEAKVIEIPYVTEVLVTEENDKITAEIYCENNKGDVLSQLKKDIAIINKKLPVSYCIQKIKLRDSEFEKTSLGKIKLK